MLSARFVRGGMEILAPHVFTNQEIQQILLRILIALDPQSHSLSQGSPRKAETVPSWQLHPSASGGHIGISSLD